MSPRLVKVGRESLLLQIINVSALHHLSTEIDPLSPFPGLTASKEQNSFYKHDTPFPANSRVLEHYMIKRWDIQRWENRDEASDDGPEQELIAPDVISPLREVLLAFWLHAEKGAAHINHLPGKEEREPG